MSCIFIGAMSVEMAQRQPDRQHGHTVDSAHACQKSSARMCSKSKCPEITRLPNALGGFLGFFGEDLTDD